MTAPLTAGRRTLLTLGVPLSLAFIGYGALGIVNAVGLTHYAQSVDLVATAQVLTVDTSDGYVRLQPSSDGAVHVHAKGVYSLSKPKLSTTSTSTGVTVTGRQCNGGILVCSQDITIDVPAGFRVTARSSGGGVSASGLTGALNLRSSAGDVEVDRPSGQLTLSSSAGDVSATNAHSTEVSASSSAGDVSLAFSTPPNRVLASSSAGDVTIRVPVSVPYKVSGSTSGGGQRDIRVPQDDASTRTITADSSAGDVSILPAG
ncbi:MAG: hypothetical protein QOJ11_602 [Frankiales bacterium]|nr:hypothetical protein [Frankiales bacterium]